MNITELVAEVKQPKNPHMPQELFRFLNNSSPKTREAIYMYLDGTHHAVTELLDVLLDSSFGGSMEGFSHSSDFSMGG